MKNQVLFLLLVHVTLLLASCADLSVSRVQTRWDISNRQVEAEIVNEGHSRAGEFNTRFIVRGPNQQEAAAVTRTSPGLNKGDVVSLVADFSEMANPQNDFLNNSREVTVTVNPDWQVWEVKRSNNEETAILKPLSVVLLKPTIRPKAININRIQEIAFSIRIEGEDAVIQPSVVRLMTVSDGTDKLLGELKDDGVAPDNIAGDSLYSGKTSFEATILAPVTFYIQADYPQLKETRRSENVQLQVLPADAPTKLRRSDLSKAVTDTATNERFLCNEIMVVAPHSSSFDLIRMAVQEVHGDVVGLFPGEKMNSWQVEIPCNGVQGVRNAVNALQGKPGIALAEPHGIARTTALIPNDPDFPQQWGLTRVQANVAWALSRGVMYNGIPIAVAVVDTGVDYNHTDLSNIWRGRDHVNGDADPMDDHVDLAGNPAGHGTHVAGIVAATAHNNTGIAGVAQTVVIAEKVCDATGSCTDGNVADGIEHATDLGATVINLSLGRYGYSQAVASAMDYANTRGRLLVAAAGNDNCSNNFYPAAFGNTTNVGGTNYDTRVIAVGATDNNDQQSIWNPGQPQCTIFSGSNFGAWVDISAPGSNIRSTLRNNNYANWNGTSMAAPHVAGTGALIWARHPWASADSVRSILMATAENTGNMDPGGNAIRRLNAFRGVMQAAAWNCVACPRAPEYEVQGNRVLLGVAGRAEADSQRGSRHGVAVPLLKAASYQINSTYRFETWDSYTPADVQWTWGWTGPRDAFSLSVSYGSPYWQQTLATPIASTPSIRFPLIWGGLLYKDTVKETRFDNLSFTMSGRSNRVWAAPDDFLNIILDTHNNSVYPSWGEVEINDITPTYTTTTCLTTQIAGQQFQVCNGP